MGKYPKASEPLTLNKENTLWETRKLEKIKRTFLLQTIFSTSDRGNSRNIRQWQWKILNNFLTKFRVFTTWNTLKIPNMIKHGIMESIQMLVLQI